MLWLNAWTQCTAGRVVVGLDNQIACNSFLWIEKQSLRAVPENVPNASRE